MRFTFEETNEDGSGQITVHAETAKEIIELERWHFAPGDLDTPEGAISYAGRLTKGSHDYVSKSKKRPWYPVSACLYVQWSTPYYDWLNRVTGYVGRGILPDLDLSPFYDRQWEATRLQNILRLEHGHIIGEGYIKSEAWDGMDAQTYAEKSFTRYLLEEFAYVEPIREYIESGNGQLRRNPDYGTGKRGKLHARACNDWLRLTLFQWWERTFANDAQKAVIAADLATVATITRVGLAIPTPCGASSYEGGFRDGWEKPIIKFAEFQALNSDNG